MICFQISIFEPLNTASNTKRKVKHWLWFAFKLVSLSHWIQLSDGQLTMDMVVICFQISIFEPLNTAYYYYYYGIGRLWFAFKLVSLSHWIQRWYSRRERDYVVICFQISIFEPLNTATHGETKWQLTLWFAFKLVSLSHWIQRSIQEKQ